MKAKSSGRVQPKPRAPKPAGTQSIQRASAILRVIAARSRAGLRLVDVAKHSSLERPTAHRILKGLMAEGIVMQDPDTRRYFLGQLIFELGLAAAPQFNLRETCQPALMRIAEKTGDTVFLSVRSGYDSVCIDRREGAFPIRALTLDVGTRRPLGVGAAGLALLMLLPEEAMHKIVSANALRLGAYNNLNVPALLKMVKRSQNLGYALNDIHITPGATSVGLPLVNRHGDPFAAISIGAISSRMTEERQKELVAVLRSEIGELCMVYQNPAGVPFCNTHFQK